MKAIPRLPKPWVRSIPYRVRRGLLSTLALVAVLFGPGSPAAEPPAEPASAFSADPRWNNLPHTDTEFVSRTYPTLADWTERREHLRRQILWSSGLWPMPERTPLNARISGRIEHDDYTVEKVAFESRPGLFVTGNLYRPKKPSPRGHPGVLNPHGHAATGRLHDDNVASYQARGITFARMGCVALIWDMIDYNDSARQLSGSYQEKSYWDVHNKPWSHEPNRRALWNINALGLQLWNSIRALDFLCSLPEVDPERLGCTGESGGGTQTFLLYAVDDRVKVAAPVCMVSAYMQGGCNCENAPGLRLDTCNVDFGAMMAPRPLLLISSTRDWTKHTAQVEYPAIQRVYELFGATDMVAHVPFEAGHGYNRDMRNAVYPWFARWLGLPLDAGFTEPQYQTEAKKDLLVFDESVPASAIRDHENLVNAVVEAASRQIVNLKPTTAERLAENRRVLGEGLRLSLGVIPFRPDEIEYARRGEITLADLRGEAGVFKEKRRGVEIPVWVFRPEGETPAPAHCALLIHGQGRAALAGKAGFIREWLTRRQIVYLIEPFGIGDARPAEAIARKRGSTRYFSTFNCTDDAERVHDIVASIGYCRGSGAAGKPPKTLNVVAFGKAGPWLAVAGATLSPPQPGEPEIRFAIDANRFDSSSEQQYLADLFIPGLLRAGGLPNAVALLAPRAVLVQNTGNILDTSSAVQAFGTSAVTEGWSRLKLESTVQGDSAIHGFPDRPEDVRPRP